MTHTPELIRGEMRLWTDLAPDALRPAPRGRVLATLLERALGDVTRVLVVGPHDPLLLAGLAAAGRELTIVLRSLPDAEAVQQAVPAARVVCGGLDAFEDDPYDAVVALDGVERVLSNDSPEASWAERLAVVRSFVADSGVLVCSVDNLRSLLSLADARPESERRDTGDWEPPPGTDPTRPLSLATAAERLGGAAYAVFPLTTAPTAMTTTKGGAAADLRVRRALAESSAALAGRDLLFDPGSELERAIAAGEATAAAPGWIFVLGADAGADAIFEDHPSRAHSLVRVLTADAIEVVGAPAGLAPVSPVAGQPLPQGPATEEPPAAAEAIDPAVIIRSEPADTLPVGDLLADRLRLLSLTEDLPALRSAVGRHLAWVWGAADPARAVFLTADNVVLAADGDLTTLDDSYAVAGPPTSDVAVGRVALDTARLLLDLRLRRIWPPWMGVPELARALASMAALTLSDEVWDEAKALDAALVDTRVTVLDEDVRSLRTMIAELRRELWSARGQVFAHERITGLRDRQLEARSNQIHELERRTVAAELSSDAARWEVDAVRGSMSFRVGRALRNPVAAARWLKQRRQRG